jgi:hypothetical protein
MNAAYFGRFSPVLDKKLKIFLKTNAIIIFVHKLAPFHRVYKIMISTSGQPVVFSESDAVQQPQEAPGGRPVVELLGNVAGAGAHFSNLHFGQKVFGQITVLEFRTKY